MQFKFLISTGSLFTPSINCEILHPRDHAGVQRQKLFQIIPLVNFLTWNVVTDKTD